MEEASGSTEGPAPATTAQSASSDEADNSESTPGSPTRALTLVADRPNRCCVDGQYQVYSDAKILNDKRFLTRTLTLERQVLMGSLPTMPEIHNLFTRHQLGWTTLSLGRYCEELVREFYASYLATLRSQIDRRVALDKQAPLEHVRVHGIQYISRCLPSDGIYMARMLMPTRPLSSPSLNTGGKLSKMANSCVSHR